MERQCRLCFDSDEITPFLTPCNCRGTQAYVHTHCLALYFQHFPDGICRVCRAKMEGMPDSNEVFYAFAVAFWSFNLAYASTLPRDVREMYLFLTIGVVVWMLYAKRLPVSIALMTMLISSIFITTSFATMMNILTASSIGFSLFLLWLYIPIQYLFLSMALGLAMFYTFAILLFALTRGDPVFGSILFSVFVYLWHLIVRARPPQRNV